MKKLVKKAVFGLTILSVFLNAGTQALAQKQVSTASPSEGQTENLAFKILQKQAAEYEIALSALIAKHLARYIAEDRFHLSVRIYWNPNKVDQLNKKNKEIRKKTGKLPGFPIYVKGEEKGLDYYLGAGSVMRIKVEVLLDETLAEEYTSFIYQVVPIQARFDPDRGDSVKINRIPFPKSNKPKKMPVSEMPLVSDEASTAVLDAINKGKRDVENLKPVILHPILQKYISDYEKYINQKLSKLISEYVEKKKFLLTVKFYWNQGEISKLKKLVVNADTEGKVKLPGFAIYLEERDSLYETLTNSTTLMKMEISIMIDESVNPEVEPFLRKLIPLSVKVIPERGDKVSIYRGYFPKLGEELKKIVSKKSDKAMQSDIEIENEITQIFQSGDYRKALLLVDLLLSKTTNPYKRLPLLKRKGTLHLMLQEKDLAKAAWEQVRRSNPDDNETIELMEYIK